MISAEPAARVSEMASIAAMDTELKERLCNAPLEEMLRAVRTHSEFRRKYEEYLAKFGDRCLEELKLESETLHENPLVLLRSVGELARAPISATRTLGASRCWGRRGEADAGQPAWVAIAGLVAHVGAAQRECHGQTTGESSL